MRRDDHYQTRTDSSNNDKLNVNEIVIENVCIIIITIIKIGTDNLLEPFCLDPNRRSRVLLSYIGCHSLFTAPL